MSVYNLISFLGIFIILGFAWLLSPEKKRINPRIILWGLCIQFVFALFIFLVPAGSRIFLIINDAAVKVLDSASQGTRFVFGVLALPPGMEGSPGFILAFQALPTIIFFSALMSILYFLNIMPVIIRAFASVFTRLMKISGAESLCAASNIFVGIESALTVKPHLQKMTRSELCTVLTAGLATVASNVLALYVFTLREVFPTIAGHLISASFLSAPAAIILSKIILPETEKPETLGQSIQPHYEKENSLFEAIINGSQAGLKMIFGVAALLIAVLGLVALVDLVLGGIGGRLNAVTGLRIDWTLKGLLGYVFYPFTIIIGVPIQDAGIISKIIGERIILTEVASYQDLSAAMAAGRITNPRSAVIAAYALCGFAHVASLSIFIGGLSAIIPERIRDLTGVAFRALLAATLACLLTACIAGVFLSKTSLLIQ